MFKHEYLESCFIPDKLLQLFYSKSREDVTIALEYMIKDCPKFVENIGIGSKGALYYGKGQYKDAWYYTGVFIEGKQIIVGSAAVWLQG